MSSPDNYIFKVQVLEGKGFGQDPQTLVCCAAFAGKTKTTQYSVNTDAHTWNSTLTWSISREDLRKAQASGTSHCKVTVVRKDGAKLGWVVVSLRSAKLQSQYKSDPQGKWLQLNATKLHSPPQLRVAYSLYEDRSTQQLPTASSSYTGAALAGSTTPPDTAATANSSRRPSSSQFSSAAASLRPSKSRSASNTAVALISLESSNAGAETAEVAPIAAETSNEVVSAAVSQQVAAGATGISSMRHSSSSIADDSAAGLEQQATGDDADEVLLRMQDLQQVPSAGPMRSRNSVQPQQQQQQQDEGTEGQQQQSNAVTGSNAADATEPFTIIAPSIDIISAAEANLPSFAQRQQQLQLQAGAASGNVINEATEATAAGELAAGESAVTNVTAAAEVAAAATANTESDPGPAAAPAEFATANQPVLDAAMSAAAESTKSGEHVSLLSQPQASPAAAAAAGEGGVGSYHRDEAITSIPVVAEQAAGAVEPKAGSLAGWGPAPQSTISNMDCTADVTSNAKPIAEEACTAAAAAAADPVRQFVFTLDVRSFQAGRRLPIALAATYVQAFLPQEMLGFLTTNCGAKIPPRIMPLRTLPAVDVMRGSEGALPNGCATVEFAASVMGLAGLLAQEPRIVLEVWHKEKLRSDLLLGVASISLSALLQECWVDGYAPVHAMMAKAAHADEQPEKVQHQQQEQTPLCPQPCHTSASLLANAQVGLLRVVLSLEDRGAPTVAAAAASPAAASRHPQRSTTSSGAHTPIKSPAAVRTPPKQHKQQLFPAADSGTGIGLANSARQQQLQQGMSAAAAEGSYPQGQQQLQQGMAAAAEGRGTLPEYIVAWELEVWKKAEESRFRAQLKELEQQRMSVIEQQWWKRERARESEALALKAQYAKLEQHTKELLAAAQERESKVIAAEADLERRRSDLERQHAARISEAEAAVRRLQVECEHQLALERDRTAAVARQRDAAEARLLAAEARAAALEAQFTEYRAAQRETPEAQLQLQLKAAQAAAAHAEQRANRALKLKQQYKQQVVQLARELTALHQQRQADVMKQLEQQRVAAAAQEQNNQTAAQQAELSALREQLAQLKAAALTAAAAQAAAAVSPGGDGSDASSYRQQQQRRQRHRSGKENRRHFGAEKETDQESRRDSKRKLQQQQQQQQQDDREQYSDGDAEHLQWDQGEGVVSGSSSSGGSSEEDSDGPAWHSQRCGLQAEQHRQQGAVSAADAALAEVAALAAILNQPRPSSAKGSSAKTCLITPGAAAEGAQQEQQQVLSNTPIASAVESLQQHQQGRLKPSAAATAGHESTPTQPPLGAPDQTFRQQLSPINPLLEVRRLLKEKVELLASGLYARDDPVVLQIDARVQALAEQQLGAE